MSKKTDKQIGDLVSINQGQHKGQDGILRDRSQRGWLVELQSKEIVNLMFPFVRLKAKKGTFETEKPWNTILNPDVTEEEGQELDEEREDRIDGALIDEVSDEPTVPWEEVKAEREKQIDIPDEIKKMTVAQLRDLAKEKGVSIARTKDDFLRIIKEKNPEEDLERLKGKVLFERVSELHISRLRSKEDLQNLLAHK